MASAHNHAVGACQSSALAAATFALLTVSFCQWVLPRNVSAGEKVDPVGDDSQRRQPRLTSDHWAFQPIRRPTPPPVKRPALASGPIDQFIQRRLQVEGLQPLPAADRATVIRRLSLDLIGLPPSLEQLQEFLNGSRPDAYQRLVDRTLASPHLGERWGRHWLDLARYADSDGFDDDMPRPHAWRYRNWVMDAVNGDLAFDRFSIEQLAGDLLPDAGIEQWVATGFQRNPPKNTESGRDREEFRVRDVVDRVNTVGTVWLGLTVACAQCHDHKYDLLSQREYYSLFAFWNSTEEDKIVAPLLTSAGEVQKWESFYRNYVQLKSSVADYAREHQSDARAVDDLQLQELKQTLEKQTELKAEAKSDVMARILRERDSRRATHVLIRGDFLQPGQQVEPNTPDVLPALHVRRETGDRLDLARWLFDPDNPLTARVVANRVWHHLFGRGLVSTLEDFGVQGAPPSHPQLLDWLASELIRRNWSQKALIQRIVTSAAYRRPSQLTAQLAERDPSNRLLARQGRFRLEGEIIRDCSLAVSGLLNTRMGGPSFRPELPAEDSEYAARWKVTEGGDRYRRGMYIFIQRTVPFPMLATFDAPDSHVTCTQRDRSNTPLQSLTLLNNSAFVQCARALALRIVRQQPDRVKERIQFTFLLCLAREPDSVEADRIAMLYHEQLQMAQAHPEAVAILMSGAELPSGATAAQTAAWMGVARTLMNLDEFVTRG